MKRRTAAASDRVRRGEPVEERVREDGEQRDYEQRPSPERERVRLPRLQSIHQPEDGDDSCGENRPREIVAAVPPDEKYDAVLIDTWEMTETPLASGVVRGQVLAIPPKPYQALLLRRAD